MGLQYSCIGFIYRLPVRHAQRTELSKPVSLFLLSLPPPPPPQSHAYIPTFLACRVSAVHVRYLVWLWLSEFSSVVLSCFTRSRSTGFTDVSLTKPEDSVNPSFKATICPLMSWVGKPVNTCAQPLRYSAVVAVTR